eukprot:130715_1
MCIISAVVISILIFARHKQSVFGKKSNLLYISAFVLVFNTVLFTMAIGAEVDCCWRDQHVLSVVLTSVPWVQLIVVILIESVWCLSTIFDNSQNFRNSRSLNGGFGLTLFVLLILFCYAWVVCLENGAVYIGWMMDV